MASNQHFCNMYSMVNRLLRRRDREKIAFKLQGAPHVEIEQLVPDRVGEELRCLLRVCSVI
ncbi:hypothetical protein IMY05_017G0105700 [Salix suchowensis]|nr:hypothetical protein IMY05_017G0105700 [Salix suchowensis]